MNMNPVLATDSYKFSHWKQLPPKMTVARSYFESRGGMFPFVLTFGALQYYVADVLAKKVTQDDIDYAYEFCNAHFGDATLFNKAGWQHILAKHGGVLPLRLRAVPEGYKVPVSNALLTVENTDPEVPWLTNYVETRLSNM
jgi:nicotinamide phosphoribosyltransferase